MPVPCAAKGGVGCYKSTTLGRMHDYWIGEIKRCQEEHKKEGRTSGAENTRKKDGGVGEEGFGFIESLFGFIGILIGFIQFN